MCFWIYCVRENFRFWFSLVGSGYDTWSEFVEISFHRVDFQNLMFQYFNSHGAKREFLTLDVVLSADVCRAVVRTLLGNWKWRSNRPLIGQQALTGRSCDRLTSWSVQCLTEASFLYIWSQNWNSSQCRVETKCQTSRSVTQMPNRGWTPALLDFNLKWQSWEVQFTLAVV